MCPYDERERCVHVLREKGVTICWERKKEDCVHIYVSRERKEYVLFIVRENTALICILLT